MNETEEFLLALFVVTAAICASVIPIVRTLRPAKNSDPQPQKPKKETFSATVVHMRCGVKMVGIKTPKAVTEFVVTFESKEFGTFDLPVTEAMYHNLEEGQTGKLTVSNGQLYSFVLGK